MELINASKLSKTVLSETLFNSIKFNLKSDDRVGIVGRNGEGKTTLLKIMAGMEPFDNGNINWKKGLSIGLLHQIPEYSSQKTIMDILNDSFSELNRIQKDLSVAEQKMAQSPENLNAVLKEYGKLQEKYIQMGGFEKDSFIQDVANGLNITPLLNQEWASLSGGERTKVGLAQILLKKPTLLLLDEPTNHLDISSIEWLTKFIKNYSGVVVIVSP